MWEIVLGAIADNLKSVILEKVQKKGVDIKVEKEFAECGNFVATFEGGFDSVLLIAFSKDNLRKIYQQLNGTNGYEYIEKLKKSLERLCDEYQIEDKAYFIEQFVNMFKKCIYENDRELAHEIFDADFRQDTNDNFLGLNEKITVINNKLDSFIANKKESDALIPIPPIDNDKAFVEEDEMLKWELHFPESKNKECSIKERVKYLTGLWRAEREKVPGWYMIPENKRAELRLYTRESDSFWIYEDDEISFIELFEFAHELIWRYEMSFMECSTKLKNRIQNIWERAAEIGDFLVSQEVKEQYFFMGQVLLRIHRENLGYEKWNLCFERMNVCSDSVLAGRDQLQLEKIKFLLMQMKVSDACVLLNGLRTVKEAYSVRMQVAGLKAECGMLETAEDELLSLENELEKIIKKESTGNKKLEIVYHKSILAESYFLHRFVYQAMKYITKDEKYNGLTLKVREYQKYFDYENERNEYYKKTVREQKKFHEKEIFELGRVIKIICASGLKPNVGYEFYRMLDRAAIPLHMGNVRLLDEDESYFISNLIDNYEYIGWYMLLRFGRSDTTKETVTRRKCIEINGKTGKNMRIIFDYVYKAVDLTVSSVQGMNENISGNAYGHILINGLEILSRFVSTATISEQKKIVTLMLKIIEADVVKGYGVLNGWIRQVMRVLDEHVKISMLNELLECSVGKGTMWHGEQELDPFDVFSYKDKSVNDYRKSYVDTGMIDAMLDSCMENEQKKSHYIPRLGNLAEWGMLTLEQSRKFGDILWENMETDDPGLNTPYYLSNYLKWPHPDNVDIKDKIKKKVLAQTNFDRIRNEALISIMPNHNRLFWEIRYINEMRQEFWDINELEFLISELYKYWKTLKEGYEKKTDKCFYEEEFTDEVRELINLLASFGRDMIQKLKWEIKKQIFQMIREMKHYDIECMELMALVCREDEMQRTLSAIMDSIKSVNECAVTSAMGATRIFLLADTKAKYIQELCDKLIVLCRYRKEPGLTDFLIALHNALYLRKVKLGRDNRHILSDALEDIKVATEYAIVIDNIADKKIRDIIEIRKSSAGLAYQLYLYEEGENLKHSKGALVWKDVCRGKQALSEFAEVRNSWY